MKTKYCFVKQVVASFLFQRVMKLWSWKSFETIFFDVVIICVVFEDFIKFCFIVSSKLSSVVPNNLWTWAALLLQYHHGSWNSLDHLLFVNFFKNIYLLSCTQMSLSLLSFIILYVRLSFNIYEIHPCTGLDTFIKMKNLDESAKHLTSVWIIDISTTSNIWRQSIDFPFCRHI